MATERRTSIVVAVANFQRMDDGRRGRDFLERFCPISACPSR